MANEELKQLYLEGLELASEPCKASSSLSFSKNRLLTRRGWLSYEHVQIGDETIGYNPKTEKSEWTKVTNLYLTANTEAFEIGYSRWSACAASRQFWWGKVRTYEPSATLGICPQCGYASSSQGIRVHLGKIHGIREVRPEIYRYGFFTTSNMTTRHQIMTTAPADTRENTAISVQEAGLLGWIMSDGHIEKRRDVPRGRKLPSITIAQAKPRFVPKIQALLRGIPHSEYSYDPKPKRLRHYTWRFDPYYALGLLRRSGYDKYNPVMFVLSLSAEQRAAWLEAVIDAEGTKDPQSNQGERGGIGIKIYQSEGPKLYAIQLAVYLSGYRPSVGRITRSDPRAKNWRTEAWVTMCKPVVTGTCLQRHSIDNQPTWNVVTELGTCTVQYGDHIYLTGFQE